MSDTDLFGGSETTMDFTSDLKAIPIIKDLSFNIEDTEGKYLEIIGNGTDDEHRSNAYAITKTHSDVYVRRFK